MRVDSAHPAIKEHQRFQTMPSPAPETPFHSQKQLPLVTHADAPGCRLQLSLCLLLKSPDLPSHRA